MVGVSSPDKELNEVAVSEGIRVVPLEMKRQVSLVNDLVSLVNMYRLIKKERPDIIHTHTPKAGMLGMVAGRMARVPVRLHTVAGLPLVGATGLKRKVLNIVEKITYACATKVYPNSYGLNEIILNNKFCMPSKLKVIGNGSSNGIDTHHFSPSQIAVEETEKLKVQLGINPDYMVFVFVGRLVKDKGINELIAAFKNLLQKHSHVKLLLVGNPEPELDPLLPETEHEINNNPNIITAGYQTDVRPYLAVANSLVFPSYREGFPNVVMQAGAMGLPAIVTDINGCNEIIITAENGEIIPPKDEQALYEKMKEWVEQPEKVAAMAGNARRLVESRYEQKIVWEAVLEEYRRFAP